MIGTRLLRGRNRQDQHTSHREQDKASHRRDCDRVDMPLILLQSADYARGARLPMALLEIQSVTRRFGDFVAVDGVTLKIPKGLRGPGSR